MTTAPHTQTGAAALLERIYETNQAEAPDGTRLDIFPSSMPRGDTRAIQRLVRELEAARTLETGMAFGVSTLAIGAVHQERGTGTHVAIDPLQSTVYRSVGALNLRRAHLEDRVRVIEEPSHVALPKLLDEGVRLDFALIDGRHLFDFVLVDFFYVDQMLDVGGVVAFHDTWMPAIAQAAGFVRRNRAYEPVRSRAPAIAALRKTGEDARKWDSHRGFAADSLVVRAALMRVAKRALVRAGLRQTTLVKGQASWPGSTRFARRKGNAGPS